MSKDLREKAVKIKGKDYILVSDRIKYLSDNYEGKYSIDTEYQYYPEDKMFIVKATITMPGGSYTGLAQEIIGDGYINKTSALENAETSAIGRACAMAGIGVIDSIASVDEINKAETREPKATDDQVLFLKRLLQKNNVEVEFNNLTKRPLNDISAELAAFSIDMIKMLKNNDRSEK